MTNLKVEQVLDILNITNQEYIEFTNIINSVNSKFSIKNLGFLKNDAPLISNSIYSYYPLMFKNIMNMGKDNLPFLIEFSHLHFISLFLLDKIYDEQKFSNSLDLLVLLDLYHENQNNLNMITTYYPDIKEEIQKYLSVTKEGFFKEKYIYSYENSLNISEIETYCYNKYSYAKIALLIYEKFCNTFLDKEIIDVLKESHDYFAVGRQILDDLDDYMDDYSHNSYNIYTNYYYKKNNLSKNLTESKPLQEELTTLSIEYLKKSLNMVKDYTESGWYRYISFYLNQALGKRNLMLNIKNKIDRLY